MASKLIADGYDKIYQCVYKIGTLIFAVGSETIQCNHSNVLSIEVLNNYEYNLRSLIKVQLRLDIRQKMWIINNKSKMLCKFELIKYGLDTENENEVRGDQTVWNEIFSVHLNDDDAAIDMEALEDALEMSGDSTFLINDIKDQNYYQAQEVMDLYLYNADLLRASKNNINRIYHTGNVASFVGNILTQTAHKKVLMSPIENPLPYEEVLIPSNPGYKALVYVDQYYGLYKRGASIFYGVDALYIINPNGKPTAWRINENPITCIFVTATTGSTPGNGMIDKKGLNAFCVSVPEVNTSMSKPLESKQDEYGSNIKIISTDDIIVNMLNNDPNAYITYQRISDNLFAQSIIQARLEENKSIAYINGNGFDINAFDLNKAFTIIFESTSKQIKYGKNRYRIAYAHHYLVNQGQQYMKSNHHIVLKKALDDESIK